MYAVLNIIITMSYIFIAVVIAPHLAISRAWVKWVGAAFFLTCGLTHLEMAIIELTLHHHPGPSPFTYVNHSVQAVAVISFVVGLYLETVVDTKR